MRSADRLIEPCDRPDSESMPSRPMCLTHGGLGSGLSMYGALPGAEGRAFTTIPAREGSGSSEAKKAYWVEQAAPPQKNRALADAGNRWGKGVLGEKPVG